MPSMTKRFFRELEKANSVAYEIGKLQLRHFESNLHVIRKTAKEFVTNVDVDCQKLSHNLLADTYPIMSEELRNPDVTFGGCFWVIDPLDGTHNFIAGLPLFGVSIALVYDSRIVVGVIYLPFFDKLYYAVEGQGAFMNGVKIYVSKNKFLEKSMITYDNQFYLNERAFERYQKLTSKTFTTRILGSAIYDFALIAAGKIDARIWNNTKLFDFAAGVLVVQEAGGRVTDFHGKKIMLDSHEIIASNGLVHNDLVCLFDEDNNGEGGG